MTCVVAIVEEWCWFGFLRQQGQLAEPIAKALAEESLIHLFISFTY